MLQNLIRFLKDGRRCLVKQGELFILTLLDKVAAFPAALYYLEKLATIMTLKLACLRYYCMWLHGSECLRASKVPNPPPSDNGYARLLHT